jgi:hypothetical protein
MRDDDVVDADRVCAEVLYSSFDGELSPCAPRASTRASAIC